jgi:hypothetical protein
MNLNLEQICYYSKIMYETINKKNKLIYFWYSYNVKVLI